MPDIPFLPGHLLVALVTTAILVTLLAVGLSRPGPRRAGLVAGGIPLALLSPAMATAYAAWQLIGLFAGIAQTGSGGARLFLDACTSLWLLQRAAWGAFAVSCLCGVVLGLLRLGRSSDDVPCSLRRGLVLLLLPLLGLAAASSVASQVGKALGVSAAVMSPDATDPASQKRALAVFAAEGLETQGAASIAATSAFIRRATMVGFFGGVTAGIVLLGLALAGFILVWRVRFEASFMALASALWLLAAVGASLVSFGVIDPLRMP